MSPSSKNVSCCFRLPFWCLLFLSLLLAGCPKPVVTGDDGMIPPKAAASPLDQARSAFSRGDYAKAESMTLRLASDSSASRQDVVEANRILAAAALQNHHPGVALAALDQWRQAGPGADETGEWQDAWCKALRSLSSHDARTRANDVYQDSSRSSLVRSIAGVCLAVRQWQDGSLGQSMVALENIYSAAATSREKAAIESRLALELHLAAPAASELAATAVTDDNKNAFPYVIILIDSLRGQSAKPESRDAALTALRELSGQVSLADMSLFREVPAEISISIQAPGGAISRGPVAGQPVVLALPLSGQYASISAKIAAGAQAACDDLSSAGGGASLVVIDTDQPDWLSRLEGLPGKATVIGGPLRRDDYTKIKARGLTSRRAVFAFLPGLESGDEGRVAWRFFSSAQDQVDTLLAFCSRLGISGYGVFYPQENFGRRMANLFEERAKAGGARSVITQSYEPGDQNNWMASAAQLLSANKSGNAFHAIFLPDSWKNMDVIVPNFFYNNETRQVLLGTSLWEQGLSGNSFVSMQYYGLAVFPGSWNPAQPTPAGAALQSRLSSSGKGEADFWSGLGYDFARFSAGLGVREGWSADVVNSALRAVALSWSIAPISWSDGLARQQMHLFTPSAKGFTPVNEQEFRTAYDEAWR